MTTLRVRRPTGRETADLALVVALGAWVVIGFGMFYGFVQLPSGAAIPFLVVFGVPGVLGLIALLRRSQAGVLPVVAGCAAAVMLAWVLPFAMSENPKIALAFPVALIGGFAAQRWPTTTFVTVFALSGTYGTLTAFTGIPADSVADKVIDAAWAGVIGRMLIGRQPLKVRATPLFFMLLGYLVITVIMAFTTIPMGNGVQALRLAPLYVSVVLLLGYGAFRDSTLEKLTRALVIVAAIVAAYAALRWAIGPSGKESALQASDFQRQYNQLAGTGDIKLQGSLPNGNSLGLWTACTIPFLVAMAVSLRGRMRLVAAGALPLAVVALLGSAQRAAVSAVVAGALTIVVLHVLSRGFRGPRLGIATAAAVVLVISAAVVYPAVVNNPEKQKRYSNLLTPSQDQPFQERLNKWRSTVRDIGKHPFGHGLGAGNPLSVSHRFEDIGYYNIDNSYLMIAYDQGLLVLGLFVLTMLVLLVELLAFAIWTRGPTAAGLTTAAAGTLVSMLVEFMAADYVVSPAIVTGWLIVGLGVAQFGSLRRRSSVGDVRAPGMLEGVGGVPDREMLAYPAGARGA
jgi:hypothetical protein